MSLSSVPPSQAVQPHGGELLIVLTALVLSLFAISSQSLWIDEANSAVKAITADGSSFTQAMRLERGSDLQMPLYMVALWGWEKVVGSSEFALRALNIPFFVLAIGSILLLLRQPAQLRMAFSGVAIVSPMVWAYLDEARPYTLQFAASTFILIALINLAESTSRGSLRDALLFFAGCLLLCGSSLLGVIYSFFFGLAFLWLWLRSEKISATLRRPAIWAAAVAFCACLGLLGLYYVWTLSVGARASGVGATNLLSMAFCGYELFGFFGAGPGRAALRENPVSALKDFVLPLAVYSLSFAIFLCSSLFVWTRQTDWRQIRRFLPVLFAVVLSMATVFTIGIVAEFRIIGRHLMPILPFLLLVVAALCFVAWNRGTRFNRAVVILFFAASLLSCLSLRFSPRFAKDDYRSAALAAKEALQGGAIVWWAADPAAANYYGVFPMAGTDYAPPATTNQEPRTTTRNSPPATSSVFFANNRSADYLAALPPAGVVILSKTDVYDSRACLRAWMHDTGFSVTKTFPAFTVWERN